MVSSRFANVLIGLVFSAVASLAWADWSRLASADGAIIYLDPQTLQRAPGTASLWILKDFQQVQIGPSREKFRSAKVFYEFNCAERLARQSYLTRYSGPMSGGGALSSDGRIYPWMPVVPAGEKAMLYELACK